MHLNGLLRVVNISMHGTKKDDKGKLGDKVDGQDEGGTFVRHQALCLGRAKGAMTTSDNIAKSG